MFFRLKRVVKSFRLLELSSAVLPTFSARWRCVIGRVANIFHEMAQSLQNLILKKNLVLQNLVPQYYIT